MVVPGQEKRQAQSLQKELKDADNFTVILF
jgi:hypothetical protein